MFTTIFNLFLIAIIMTLIYDSGFFISVDEWINKKFKFYHLPHPFFCSLCGTWWMCLLYIIIAGQFSLLNIAFCLIAAYSTHILTPLFKTIENLLLKLIDIFNRWIGF